MFDLNLSQQIPAAALTNEIYRKAFIQCAFIVFAPFQAEDRDDYTEAVRLHKHSIDVLNQVKVAKNIRKFNRKMWERQITVHEERIKYLTSLNNTFTNILPIPTRSLKPDLSTYSLSGPLSQTANPTRAPPLRLVVTYDSDLVDLGVRSCWYLIKDTTNTHTLYALQGIWDLDKPIVETILRRPDEFFPMGGCLHVLLAKQPAANFKLRVQRRGDENPDVWEFPASACGKKEWSPRRFSYRGRHFVWKNEEGKDSGLLSKKWAFEVLYETRDDAEGSETVGEKLFSGRSHGKGKARWYLDLCPGLDPFLQEHVIAIQLSRMFRWLNPPDKDVAGLEKGIVALEGINAAFALASLVG